MPMPNGTSIGVFQSKLHWTVFVDDSHRVYVCLANRLTQSANFLSETDAFKAAMVLLLVEVKDDGSHFTTQCRLVAQAILAG